MLEIGPIHAALAKHACRQWHYSRTVPIIGRAYHFGVLEHGAFKGAVSFGQGAWGSNASILGFPTPTVTELMRVALDVHESPVSQILHRIFRMLRASQPSLRLILSYADPEHGHHGGVYQVAGFIYAGETGRKTAHFDSAGRRIHSRLLNPFAFNGASAPQSDARIKERRARLASVTLPPKYRYIWPMRPRDRKRLRREYAHLSPPRHIEAIRVDAPPAPDAPRSLFGAPKAHQIAPKAF